MRLAVSLALLVLTAACSGAPSSTSATTSTPPPDAPASTAAPLPTTPQQAAPTTAAKTCTVPNVVGMIHQAAQDTMQAAGLFFLREEDASGQGRLLINDRNWKTTAQSAAAGSVVDCNTQILLSATKIDGLPWPSNTSSTADDRRGTSGVRPPRGSTRGDTRVRRIPDRA